jgi:hypothetical protein
MAAVTIQAKINTFSGHTIRFLACIEYTGTTWYQGKALTQTIGLLRNINTKRAQFP